MIPISRKRTAAAMPHKNSPRPLFSFVSVIASFVVLAFARLIEAQSPITKIPLSQCYSSVEQPGFKQFPAFVPANKPPSGDQIAAARFSKALLETGPSTIFIVGRLEKQYEPVDSPNDEFAKILYSASMLLRGERSAEFPFSKSNAPYWLFLHLGSSHSSPRRWSVTEITRSEATISVKILSDDQAKKSSKDRTADRVPYFFFVPLGNIPAQPLELRVIDSDTNLVTLSRRVKIAKSEVEID